MKNQFVVIFKDYPIAQWVMSIAAIGVGIAIFLSGIGASIFLLGNEIPISLPELDTSAILGGGLLTLFISLLAMGLGCIGLVFSYVLIITADKRTRTLTLDYRSLIQYSTRRIAFDDIETICITSPRHGAPGHRRRRRPYRINVLLKNGEGIPLRLYYSGGLLSGGLLAKQKIAKGLCSFIGLPYEPEWDGTLMGFFRQVPRQIQTAGKRQQKTLAATDQGERITNGVHWTLQFTKKESFPITRWFTPDSKMRDGFLLLAQKPAEQSNDGILASLGKTLFKHIFPIYGFTPEDTPNLASAEHLASLPASIDPHFSALTTNQTEACQLLNPWAVNLLAAWVQRHPTKQFQSTQLIVLFSPKGFYLATLGNLQQQQVDELTALGVDLVKAWSG